MTLDVKRGRKTTIQQQQHHQNSRGKRAISVRATEVLPYFDTQTPKQRV